MRRLNARLAAAGAVAVAIAVGTSGAAFAGGGHGNGNGNGNGSSEGQSQQSQPQPQQEGMQPSATTSHWTHTKVGSSPDVSKRYGNGKTAAQIATSKGAPDSADLTGPGNSQPHKINDCRHKSNKSGGVDVHAYKGQSACETKTVEAQQPVQVVGYCEHEGNTWVYKTTTADKLAEIVKTHDVIAPSFSYQGHSYSKHWDSAGESIYKRCQHGEHVPVQQQAPTTTVVESEHKVTICHATGSSTNPYVQITVDVHALKHGHTAAKGDIIPAPASGCPTAAPAPVAQSVSFCDMESPTSGKLETKSADKVVSHELNGTPEEARDIVPPFTFNGASYSQNWDTNGQAIFNNGCAAVAAPAPAPVTATTTTVQTTTQAEAPVATTVTVPATTIVTVTDTVASTTTVQQQAAVEAAATPSSNGGVLGAQTSLASPKKSSGGVLGTAANIAGGTLPFTGFPVWLAVLIALALILAGIALRRRSLGGQV